MLYFSAFVFVSVLSLEFPQATLSLCLLHKDWLPVNCSLLFLVQILCTWHLLLFYLFEDSGLFSSGQSRRIGRMCLHDCSSAPKCQPLCQPLGFPSSSVVLRLCPEDLARTPALDLGFVTNHLSHQHTRQKCRFSTSIFSCPVQGDCFSVKSMKENP